MACSMMAQTATDEDKLGACNCIQLFWECLWVYLQKSDRVIYFNFMLDNDHEVDSRLHRECAKPLIRRRFCRFRASDLIGNPKSEQKWQANYPPSCFITPIRNRSRSFLSLNVMTRLKLAKTFMVFEIERSACSVNRPSKRGWPDSRSFFAT